MQVRLSNLGRDACRDLDLALATEWLATDGVGGYASSTPLLCPTRRYHGLLVALPDGAAKRHLFLARFDETVLVDAEEHRIGIAKFRDGEYAPRGDLVVESFSLQPYPVTTYRVGGIEIERAVVVAKGAPTVLSRYSVRGGDVELELRPLLACREADALTYENDVAITTVERSGNGVVSKPYEALPGVHLTCSGADWSFEDDAVWYRGLEYAADIERGYDGHEDQLSPGRFRVRLANGAAFVVAATIGDPVEDPESAWRSTSGARRQALAVAAERHPDDAVRARVELAAEEFLYVVGKRRIGVCAGYPWFGEWGRDTFIALPGLTLACGRAAQFRGVLEGALPFLRDGLLPNIYGVGREDSHYGSVDAALWFARAVEIYDRAHPEQRDATVETFLPALREIATAYRDGTELGVGADDGMLISAGGPELNATWMDAQTSEGPVTPRDGCAVEINALWYSLVDHLVELERSSGDESAVDVWCAVRSRIAQSYLERLWLDEDGYLADRWIDSASDHKIRPNMVIAAALVRSPLTPGMRSAIVDCATRELLTPCGLRTLSPSDEDYVARYGGGCDERDGAYHQGTVWPWLLGFYTEACLRAHGRGEVRRLRKIWSRLAGELDRAGLEHLSEVFDGDAPHTPGGTVAQAWNTAEFLRSAALLDEFDAD